MLNSYFFVRFINLALRILSMGAKFLLIAQITKNFSVADLGEYGLFTATITLLLYFIGLDFYTFVSREFLSKDNLVQMKMIKNQFIFHIISYILLFVVFVLSNIFYFQSIDYFCYLFLILITEHLSQEIYRIFVLLSKSVYANIMLFLRSGLWCYIVLLVWHFDFYQNINFVYFMWLIFNIFSLLLGMYWLYRMYGKAVFCSIRPIDWDWIKKGIKLSIPFFIGTICYKIIEFSNRYIIDLYMTKTEVGIYVFFFSIVNATQVLIYTLVIIMYYPKLIEFFESDKIKFNQTKKKFFFEICIYSMVITLGIVFTIDFVLDYMGKSELFFHKNQLWLLLLASFFMNLSYVPHYELFVRKQDITLRNIMIFLMLLSIPLNFLFIKFWGVTGASYALIILFIIMFLCKYYFSKKSFVL